MESLHGVRKAAAKPWRRPEVAPPKVYHIEPREFRSLVQRLTGTDESLTSAPPLKETANPPPALDLAPRAASSPPPHVRQILPADGFGEQLQGRSETAAPAAELAWCSFLLSPGSLAALESSSSPVLTKQIKLR